ncbi:MAG: nitrogen regulation protein NR(II) [Thermodesulfobacteriota bacterium]
MSWLTQKRVRSSLYFFLPVFFASFVFGLGLTVLAAMELLLPLSDTPIDKVNITTFYGYVKTATGVTVLLAIGSGVVVAYALSRPLKRLENALEGVRKGRMDEVTVEGTNEFVSLSKSLNETIASVRRELKERKQFDVSREVERLERLASLGALAAGVAHEIRNPLGSTKGLAQLISEGAEKGSDMERYSEVIISEVDHMNHVVENLLDLSRSSVEEMEEIDFHRLLKEGIDSAIAVSKKEVKVSLVANGNGIRIVGDYERLKRALVNIINNAVDASPEGEEVKVSLLHDSGRGLVAVDILNHGAAIEEGEIERIFEPFYTKKAKGTGLGLAIAHTIVTSHGGRILVESGKETTLFTVELPLEMERRGA